MPLPTLQQPRSHHMMQWWHDFIPPNQSLTNQQEHTSLISTCRSDVACAAKVCDSTLWHENNDMVLKTFSKNEGGNTSNSVYARTLFFPSLPNNTCWLSAALTMSWWKKERCLSLRAWRGFVLRVVSMFDVKYWCEVSFKLSEISYICISLGKSSVKSKIAWRICI